MSLVEKITRIVSLRKHPTKEEAIVDAAVKFLKDGPPASVLHLPQSDLKKPDFPANPPPEENPDNS